MTEPTQALVVSRAVTPTVWEMILSVAAVAHKSRMFGVTSPEAAAVILLKGHELGLGMMASFEFVQLVEGRPSLSPRGALAILQSHPEIEKLEIFDHADGQGCTVTMKRRGRPEYSSTYTVADAERAGLVKAKGNWTSYPGNMCRWRAVGFCADVVAPDLIGGLKRADEYGADISREGDVIEHEPSVTLDQLTEQYGAKAVLTACGGDLPSTPAELEACRVVLEAASEPEVAPEPAPEPEQPEQPDQSEPAPPIERDLKTGIAVDTVWNPV